MATLLALLADTMYSHASPIVRSVPPSLVRIDEVSFLERYSELTRIIHDGVDFWEVSGD
jgi:hypothetical protein